MTGLHSSDTGTGTDTGAGTGTGRPALFGTVLVANRGEIACRVIRSLHRLGIRAVAVYSDADADAPHVALADEAVRLGPAPARESYLDVEAVVAAARATGADAVHPGYGFLSENPALAEACEREGIVFVGPGVHALQVMGDKIAAKAEVTRHGVPTIPGIAEPGLTDDQLIAAAEEIGYPVLVKPSAGGGGKGMQAVRIAGELPEALRTARRVAAAAFGDDTLFLERLVSAPRHIEVQVLADRHGGVVHLGERECSLQRRHQKVIEEAPSALLDPATRARIGEAACRVAASVEYVGAGTVEFLVSAEAPDEFFFMEMNTRLQVEHPVTELVTGVDLVEQQLRIAAGEPLAFAQEDVRLTGHAVEARVYAEDPGRGFLPAGGRVLALREPTGEGVRVDSGLAPGLPVVTEYDPMLAKVIAWGQDRAEALARLDRALAGTAILGAVTNVGWLRDLLADPGVRAGTMDTTLIDRRVAAEEPGPADAHAPTAELIAAALLAHGEREQRPPAGVGPVWGAPSGWRLGSPRPVRYDVAGAEVTVAGPLVSIDGEDHDASLRLLHTAADAPEAALLTLDGVVIRFDVARDGETVWLGREGRARAVRLRDRADRLAERLAALDRGDASGHPELRSPMPGTVIAVAVDSGATVATGDTVVVVEAMKMEHRLLAPVDGVVRLHVAPGDLVRLDQLVAEVDAATDPTASTASTSTNTSAADVPPAPPAPADEAVLTPSAGPERTH